MRFDLDHDWQGSISTPRAKVGERAKGQLLISLCAIWLFFGLVGHAPWKPFEAHSISIIKNMLETGNLVAPVSTSGILVNPPLYYWSAAIFAKIFGIILPMHDAARLATGMWMVITLLMVGMTGRELWGAGYGRQTTFVFIGAFGLLLSAHTLMPAISALTAVATGFYALALAKRRPFRASALLGLSMGVGFLSTGLLPFLIVAITGLALPCLFSQWRNDSYAKVLGIAFLVASPFLFIWPTLCAHLSPELFDDWWSRALEPFTRSDYVFHHIYFLNTLLWYAWPAMPLAVWGWWRFRHQLFSKPKFQLITVFFTVTWLLLGLVADEKEVFALPLLVPLTAMAGGTIETLKRGTASALNWFGLTVFGLVIGLLWFGWYAMLSGNPAKIKARLTFLSGLHQMSFSMLAVVAAGFVSLIWLFAILRSRHTNRSSTTNWAIGITCVWTLLMTLWLPMIDSARSYAQVYGSLKQALPKRYACVTSSHLGSAQRDLLYYYTDIKTQPFETVQRLDCDLYLIQNDRNRDIKPGPDWKQIWHGQRRSERHESFRLYKHV